MNEYIFYTTEGYTFPPREDKRIENCQLLGRSYGMNVKDARESLIQNCPWIRECGFNIHDAITKQLLTEENKQDINTVVQYLFDNEYRHFKELDEPDDHIYHTLMRLKNTIS